MLKEELRARLAYVERKANFRSILLVFYLFLQWLILMLLVINRTGADVHILDK